MKKISCFVFIAIFFYACKPIIKKEETKTLPTLQPGISKVCYGLSGTDTVYQYTLTNRNGMIVKILNYGGTVTDILVPDRNDKPGDVILGFDSLSGYLQKKIRISDVWLAVMPTALHRQSLHWMEKNIHWLLTITEIHYMED